MENEKVISKKDIEKKICKECKKARTWCRGNRGSYCIMRIDTSDAKIWTDFYVSENDYSIYHYDTIKQLYHDAVPYATKSEKERGYIDNAIHQLRKAGWKIIE